MPVIALIMWSAVAVDAMALLILHLLSKKRGVAQVKRLGYEHSKLSLLFSIGKVSILSLIILEAFMLSIKMSILVLKGNFPAPIEKDFIISVSILSSILIPCYLFFLLLPKIVEKILSLRASLKRPES